MQKYKKIVSLQINFEKMKKKIIVILLVLAATVGVMGVWMYQMFFGPAVENRFTVILR